jgi:2,5-diamino-6-(ribosylamino)-4(3H)-pyrimidinone 5'-phosphate reductase
MGRPFIHINFAAQGACGLGETLSYAGNISCLDDWNRVHVLRERYDGIAVGGRTWNLDRPRLTARADRLGRDPRRQPLRVIFAGSHPCEVTQPGTPAFVVSNSATAEHNVVVLAMTGHDLHTPLACLYDHGIESLLVEGGPTLLRSFLGQGMADLMTVFVRASSAEAADRGVRESLGPLPENRRVSPFGEGFLLEAGQIERTLS